MEITIKESKTKGFALAEEDGKTAGKMTYSKFSASNIIINNNKLKL